jgi:hypothetical protein
MMGGQGNALVPAALIGWVPFVSWIFSKVPPRQGAAIAFVLSLMFLPVASIPISGLPDYTKVTATCAGIVLAAWRYDNNRVLTFRPGLVDIPMLLWCASPFFASVVNGLGAYDGASNMLDMLFVWGLPYFVGRLYFSDAKGLSVISTVVFVGGLIYIPFCFEEMIMSPQLHRLTYGFHQHSILQSMRGGGFRPMVYMEHGLMVAMFMVSGSMMGVWLRYAGLMPTTVAQVPFVGTYLKKIPFWVLLSAQLVTTVLMKSTGAFALFAIGLGVLFFSNRFKTTALVWILLAIPPAYMVTRSTGWWTGENLSSMVAEKFSEERGQSLQFRFDNETILIDKALQGSFFGWGGWGRSRVYDEDGRDISVTDGLWIITLGTKGIFGLVMLTVVILLPVLLLLYRSVPAQWSSREYAPLAAMCVLLELYMIDNLLNGMINPIFMLFNGGICGLLARGVPHAETLELEQKAQAGKAETSVSWLGDGKADKLPRFL